ncbi:MAG: hypothetical protein AAF432_15350 [Planctomycetota bacterium]
MADRGRFTTSMFIACALGALLTTATAHADRCGLGTSPIHRGHSSGLSTTGYHGGGYGYRPLSRGGTSSYARVTYSTSSTYDVYGGSSCGTYGGSTYHGSYGYPYNGYFPTRYDITPFTRTHYRPRAYYRYFYGPYQRPSRGDIYFRRPNARAFGFGITAPLHTPSASDYVSPINDQSQSALAPERVQLAPHAPKLFMDEPLPEEAVPYDEFPAEPLPDDRGWDLLVKGEVAQAIDEFIEDSTVYPNRAAPRIGFAICASLQDDDDAAVWAMKRAFALDPLTVQRFAGSAEVNSEIRDLLAHFNASIANQVEPDGDAQFMVAALHFLLGDDAASGRSMEAVLAAADSTTQRSSRARATQHLREAIDSRVAVAQLRADEQKDVKLVSND